MSEERPPKNTTFSNDSELVVIAGPSVHTPGEQAKPRPSNRPRLPIDPKDLPAHVFIDLDGRNDRPANDP